MTYKTPQRKRAGVLVDSITKRQRIAILADWWPRACDAQGWDPGDRALRLEVIGEAVGKPITSLNDLNSSTDIDRVRVHLLCLAENLGALLESSTPDAGDRRRILWLIRKHSTPLGGEPYILSLARDRFHLVAGLRSIEDLSTDDLHKLMITLNARRHRKGQQDVNASLTSEETFDDQVEFLPDAGIELETITEPELCADPF